jgi:hypothetical protein
MWDCVMDKSGAGVGFLRELRFPLPIYIPSAFPQSSSPSPKAGTIGQEWPQCQKPHKKKTLFSVFSVLTVVFKINGAIPNLEASRTCFLISIHLG